MSTLQQLASAQASGALAELASQAPTSRPAWWLIAAVAVFALCVSGGGRAARRRRRRNPGHGECPHGELEPARCAICLRAAGQKWPPRHLGTILREGKARLAKLQKTYDGLNVALERADRLRTGKAGGNWGLGIRHATKIRKAIGRVARTMGHERQKLSNAIEAAEDKYDAERSYRPIKKKNPKTWRTLGAQIKRSKERIARLTKRQARLVSTWTRLASVDDDPDARRVSDRQDERRWERQRRFSEAEQEASRAIRRERIRMAKAIKDAEATYDAERRHRPIKKNGGRASTRAAA